MVKRYCIATPVGVTLKLIHCAGRGTPLFLTENDALNYLKEGVYDFFNVILPCMVSEEVAEKQTVIMDKIETNAETLSDRIKDWDDYNALSEMNIELANQHSCG